MKHSVTRKFERTPIFIICRDRLAFLAALVQWLERAGYERLYLLDNDSAWQPLLDYYERTPHSVIRLGENAGHMAPWTSGIVERYARGERYVVTDPDVVPDETCPPDVLPVLARALDKYPDSVKAGLGLRTDDLPTHYPLRDEVITWERRYMQLRLSRLYYRSSVDTTFALYREDSDFAPWPAIRTGHPYLARHMTWYQDPAHPTEEELFYAARASQSATWTLSPPHRDIPPQMSTMEKVRWYAYAARVNLASYGRQVRTSVTHRSPEP